jgi:AraC-like DNA-binding protein
VSNQGPPERLFLRMPSRQLTWPPPDRASSQFHETDPDRGLGEHVAKIRWGHEWIPPASPVQERILPDGAVHLLFVFSNQSGGGTYGLALGPTSEATVVRLAGQVEHVEIELRAGAVPALLGIPAGELSGRSILLEDLWRDRAAVIQERLGETADPAGRIRIVQETLARALAERRSETPPVVGEALRRIGRAAGNLRVGALAGDLGISDRRLEQLFHLHVGLSPKSACRLARFQGSVDLLARAARRPAWAEIALHSGFFDQAHLVNEFKAMTGLAPGDFQRRAGFGFLQDQSARHRYLPGEPTGRNRP